MLVFKYKNEQLCFFLQGEKGHGAKFTPDPASFMVLVLACENVLVACGNAKC